MREKKVFEIVLDTQEEVDKLKKELGAFSIVDSSDSNTYDGITSFTEQKIGEEIKVTLSTYLELDEFKHILDEHTNHPKIYRYGIEIKMQ